MDDVGMSAEELWDLIPGIRETTKYLLTGRGNLRIGQAFMNALPDAAYEFLTRSTHDPFYWDSWGMVADAVEYLIERAPLEVTALLH